jgi:hypothetical protein
MRREALPIRNGMNHCQNDVNHREQRVLALQREQYREECRRQHHLKEQKADRKQSAKAKKKKKGGGVRASMEKGKTIARNREHWANMCGNKKMQQDEQGRTPQEEQEQEQRQKGTPAEDEPSNSGKMMIRQQDDEHVSTPDITRPQPTQDHGGRGGRGGGGGARGAPESGEGQH